MFRCLLHVSYAIALRLVPGNGFAFLLSATRSLYLVLRPANAILTTEMHGLPLLQVVAVAMLILANAFFVAAEFALVSVRDTRIEQLLAAGVPGARAVRRLQHSLDDFLPAVQLGVTLCSLALGWIGEPLAAGVFLGWMSALPQPLAHANAVCPCSSSRRCRSGIRRDYLLPRNRRGTRAQVIGPAPC